jgi:hypothetical protein
MPARQPRLLDIRSPRPPLRPPEQVLAAAAADLSDERVKVWPARLGCSMSRELIRRGGRAVECGGLENSLAPVPFSPALGHRSRRLAIFSRQRRPSCGRVPRRSRLECVLFAACVLS